MRIIKLQGENFKKLKAVEIVPNDDMITIEGPNGAGKSSILDLITACLCGEKAIDAQPITKGEDKGMGLIDMGDFIVKRSFTPGKSYLKIETPEGKQIASPQKFLDQIVGKVSFDPLEFMNNEKEKQRNILLGLLGIDVDEMDQKEKEAREERTVIGREVKRLEGAIRTFKWHPDLKDEGEVSVAELTKTLQKGMEESNKYEQEVKDNEALKERAKKTIERIRELRAEIEELEQNVEAAKERYRETKEGLAGIVLIDLNDVRNKISGAEDRNKMVRENQEYAKAKRELDVEQKKYDGMTREIEGLGKKRKEMLDGAPMPVPGLSFDQTGLIYNGIPLEQCSDGEKLMVSIGISMALNPTMRVLRIKDGSLLDAKNREIIRGMLKEKDYQLWFESVSQDGKTGILIEGAEEWITEV